MKSIVSILLLSALAVLGQPPLLRNPATTNGPVGLSNYVYSIASQAVGSNTVVINGNPTVDDFTIVQFEDIQKAVATDQGKEYLTNAVTFLIANKTALNVKAVLVPGDLVDAGNVSADWFLATNQLWRLTLAGIPFYASAGNHDTVDGSFTAWNSHLFQMLSSQPGYVSPIAPADVSAASWVQTNSGVKMLFVAAGYTTNNTPFGNINSYVQSIAGQYPNHTVLVMSHAYLSSSGILLNNGDSHYYPGTTGVDLWNAWRGIPNLSQVLCGHDWPGEASHLVQTGDANNRVDALFFNNQDVTDGGANIIRLYTWQPSQGKIRARTYDTATATYGSATNLDFVMPMAPASQAAMASIPSRTFNVLDFGAVPDGTTDSSTAFQNAVDATTNAGGVVYVPRGAGAYKAHGIKLPQTINANNLSEYPTNHFEIIGDGRSSVISAIGSSDPIFVYDCSGAPGAITGARFAKLQLLQDAVAGKAPLVHIFNTNAMADCVAATTLTFEDVAFIGGTVQLSVSNCTVVNLTMERCIQKQYYSRALYLAHVDSFKSDNCFYSAGGTTTSFRTAYACEIATTPLLSNRPDSGVNHVFDNFECNGLFLFGDSLNSFIATGGDLEYGPSGCNTEPALNGFIVLTNSSGNATCKAKFDHMQFGVGVNPLVPLFHCYKGASKYLEVNYPNYPFDSLVSVCPMFYIEDREWTQVGFPTLRPGFTFSSPKGTLLDPLGSGFTNCVYICTNVLSGGWSTNYLYLAGDNSNTRLGNVAALTTAQWDNGFAIQDGSSRWPSLHLGANKDSDRLTANTEKFGGIMGSRYDSGDRSQWCLLSYDTPDANSRNIYIGLNPNGNNFNGHRIFFGANGGAGGSASWTMETNGFWGPGTITAGYLNGSISAAYLQQAGANPAEALRWDGNSLAWKPGPIDVYFSTNSGLATVDGLSGIVYRFTKGLLVGGESGSSTVFGKDPTTGASFFVLGTVTTVTNVTVGGNLTVAGDTTTKSISTSGTNINAFWGATFFTNGIIIPQSDYMSAAQITNALAVAAGQTNHMLLNTNGVTLDIWSDGYNVYSKQLAP